MTVTIKEINNLKKQIFETGVFAPKQIAINDIFDRFLEELEQTNSITTSTKTYFSPTDTNSTPLTYPGPTCDKTLIGIGVGNLGAPVPIHSAIPADWPTATFDTGLSTTSELKA